MICRVLPCTEWGRLDHTELATVYPVCDPTRTTILVVEEGDEIVGCWAVIELVHLEGLYVSPAHRKKGVVAKHLLDAMWRIARDHGARAVITGSLDPDVTRLIEALGGIPMPGTQFAIPVKET